MLQFICKFLYLAFPRDIHDSVGIVGKALVQKNKEPGFDSRLFDDLRRNNECILARATYSAPSERIREIWLNWLRCFAHLCASEGRSKNDKQQKKTPFRHIPTSPGAGKISFTFPRQQGDGWFYSAVARYVNSGWTILSHQ
jgi:hypothetical protein